MIRPMNPLFVTRRLAAALLMLLAASARAQFCPFDAGDTVKKIVACKEGTTTAECRELASKVGCSVVRELPSINAIVIEVPAFRSEVATTKLIKTQKVDLVEEDAPRNWLKQVTVPAANPAPFGWTDDVARIIDRARGIKAPAAKPVSPSAEDPEQPWGIRRVNAQAAWSKLGDEGAGAEVAVIDTGISKTHPDLAGVVLGGYNALDPKNPDNWGDDEGHGSHVAGTIAALRDGKGVVGVAPKAKLWAVKVLDADGNGGFSDVIAGIEWAAAKGIKVANMSLGADTGSEALARAVTAASKKGLLIVAASGNAGAQTGYPARYPEVISVGASDKNDVLASFSNFGKVELIAPGVKVESVNMKWQEDGKRTVALSGTSMATPHVAGLAALAVARGARTPAQIKAKLLGAATMLDGVKPDAQGKGMVDAGKL